MKKSIYQEYFDLHNEYVKKFGEKTMVFMQVGSFFELYSIRNQTESYGPDLYELRKLINTEITRKNNKDGNLKNNNIKNPLMSGLPLMYEKKYSDILIEKGYKVVIMEQIKKDDGNIGREITKILSNGMNISADISSGNQYTFVLYIDEVDEYERTMYSIGLSIIDITTGKNSFIQLDEKIEDRDYVFNEFVKWKVSLQPKEYVLYGNITSPLELIKKLQLNYEKNLYNFFNQEIESCYFKDNYQNEQLKSFFPHIKIQSNSLKFNLGFHRKNNALVSYLLMLNYTYLHYENILNDLPEPKLLFNDNKLHLDYTAIEQLNIIDPLPHKRTLFKILNKTKTSIGKRLLHQRLLNPEINIEKLNERYNKLEFFKDNVSIRDDIMYQLSFINDLMRLYRLLQIKRLEPCQLFDVYQQCKHIKTIYNKLSDNSLFKYLDASKIEEFINYIESIFEVNNLMQESFNKMTLNFFKKGLYKNIDEIQKELDVRNTNIKKHLDFFNDTIKDTCGFTLKLPKFISRYLIEGTESRCKKVLNNMNPTKKYMGFLRKQQLEVYKKKYLDSDLIERLCTDKWKLEFEDMKPILKECYINELEKINSKYRETFKEMIKNISEIDLSSTLGKISQEWKYVKPTLNKTKKSCVTLKKVRHAIIEQIQDDEEYIPNDISLGNNIDGKLIFGVNAVGKSSLSKSIALCIILAQIGCFVPAEECTLSPYKKIFTRILNHDNIYQGQSTFAVEMTELSNILKRADEHSLIIGDELCCSTESKSAISLVLSSIEYLSKKKSSFIFATHLRELADELNENPIENVSMNHLLVDFDGDTLIYKRILKDGPGPNDYGIEVARHMGLPKEIVNRSLEIRRKLDNKLESITDYQTSKYNTKVIMKECKICNKNSKEIQLDTHHINFQKDSDCYGILDNKPFHKNIKHNLIVLCKDCHTNVHHGSFVINGYVNTSDGQKLDYEIIKKEEKKIEKLSDEFTENQIKIIKDLKDIPKMTLKKALSILLTAHNIKITSYKLKKYWK